MAQKAEPTAASSQAIPLHGAFFSPRAAGSKTKPLNLIRRKKVSGEGTREIETEVGGRKRAVGCMCASVRESEWEL